jgi:hypothetical protein
MATLHPHTLVSAARVPAARDDARIRRLCVLAIVAAVLLGAYVGGLAWVTHQVEAGVDRSLQQLPTIVRDQPQA